MASRKAILERAIAKEAPDLDDPQAQAQILAPSGEEITLGGQSVRIFPLSGRGVRELSGFARVVYASSEGDGPIGMRICGVLMQPRYLNTLLAFVATSTFESPADVDPEQHQKRVVEFDKSTANNRGVDELGMAFAKLIELNRAMPEETPAKKEA